MNKASSALLATAGVTAGLLGFALPAGAAVSHAPYPTTCTYSLPNSNPQGTTDSVNFQGDHSGKGDFKGRGKHNSGNDNSHGNPGSDPRNPCHHRTPPPCSTPPPCPRGHEGFSDYVKQQTSEKKSYKVCNPVPCPHQAKRCHPRCKTTGSRHHHNRCKTNKTP